MTSKKELQRTINLAIILLIVGTICYAAFPVEEPKEPVRKMFKTTAGKVLFTHKTHKSSSGYGASCADCHHHYEEDEADLKACNSCHKPEVSKAVPSICLDCHEPGEAHHSGEASESFACADCHNTNKEESPPQACSDCHEPDEIEDQEKPMNFQKKSDAFHTQCISCHKEYGAGPVECSSCHVM